MRDLFTQQANFSPTCGTSFWTDSIVHKAHIEVDRNGTKATGVTMIGVGCLPAEYDIWLDRPFLHAVVNTETELPAFAGIVNCMKPCADEAVRGESRTTGTRFLTETCAENFRAGDLPEKKRSERR